MNLGLNEILFVSSILLFISVLLSNPSRKFGIPELLVYLGVGMVVGNGGQYDFVYNYPQTTESLSLIALGFIIFTGGLDTRYVQIQAILKEGLSLSTLGVLLTTLITGGLFSFFTPYSFTEGLLLGAIVSSTDAAAVFSILRTQKIRLKEHIAPTLELESGSNDPMAYLLTISIANYLNGTLTKPVFIISEFLFQIIVGAGFGLIMGKLCIWFLHKFPLKNKGLYPVLLFSCVLFTFTSSKFLNGNSLLAVYITGLIIGNSSYRQKIEITEFFEGNSWLMQVSMFLLLGLQSFPQLILPQAGKGLLVATILIFIARPLSVLLCYLPYKASWKKKIFISWVGLRGASPIVFAIFPVLHGVEHGEDFFNIVFFVVLTSVLIQGSTLTPIAKWLGLVEKEVE
ncbi:potassium/proton antiporter [Xanthovirga aplysinae]|uniref:potassium/proton antiporter n=1 Tax=Xanthovirga aplysinae TaxID=2529853 RepID=UPI0012BD619B|nr:potassium/proton antiporter [Xanthovirga aplysinae]